MKTTITPLLAIGVAVMVASCTSIKKDDHSSVYFYQHQAAPPRQIIETVTTNSTRTRRYDAQDEDVLPESPSVSSVGSELDFIQPLESSSGRGEKRYVR